MLICPCVLCAAEISVKKSLRIAMAPMRDGD